MKVLGSTDVKALEWSLCGDSCLINKISHFWHQYVRTFVAVNRADMVDPNGLISVFICTVYIYLGTQHDYKIDAEVSDCLLNIYYDHTCQDDQFKSVLDFFITPLLYSLLLKEDYHKHLKLASYWN